MKFIQPVFILGKSGNIGDFRLVCIECPSVNIGYVSEFFDFSCLNVQTVEIDDFVVSLVAYPVEPSVCFIVFVAPECLFGEILANNFPWSVVAS